MRERLNTGIRKLLLRLGVKQQKVDYYRDIALCFPVFFGIIMALFPVVDLLMGQHVTGTDLRTAAEGLVIIFVFSAISPNWGDVLAGALGVAAIRGGIGFLATRSLSILVLSAALLVLAAVCHRLRPGNYG